VDNADLGIPDPGRHPVLVIGGSSFQGGPVRIAPGSGSRTPSSQEIALPVDPGDCDPENMLSKHTRFRINEARRLPVEKLRRRACRLKKPKLDELMMLRQHGL
jgi:hypothetical protein